jgi:hypothetical protein
LECDVDTSSTGDPLAHLSWRKASLSAADGNCVEAAWAGDRIAVRHSKDPMGPVLLYTADEWHAFLEGVKKGEFDDLG